MKFVQLFIGTLVVLSVKMNGQSISLTDNQTATVLANKIKGNGISISSPTLTCNALSNGIFANVNPFPTQSLAIDSGIVLCTGRVLSTATDTGINATRFRLASNNMGGTTTDAQIASLAASGAVQKDLCYLQFNFIPLGDSAFIDYSFASEDYPEYACSQFVDAMGIFVQPPSSSVYTNHAKVPGTLVNVSINSINDTSKQTGISNYNTYCVGLGSGSPFYQFYTDNTVNNHIVYDGMTKVLKARIPVLPNQTHTMKIAIADIYDAFFDSGLFLKQYSFISPPLLQIIDRKSTNNSSALPLYLIEGCNAGVIKFSRSSASAANTVNVAFSGTASSSDYSGTTSFTIPVGAFTYDYNISAVLDGLTEGLETLKLTFTSPSIGFTDSANYVIKDFAAGVSVYNNTNDTTICNNSSITLYHTKSDTMFSTVWTPSTNLSCTNCLNTVFTANNGNIFSTQVVNLRISAMGCASVDTPISIYIQPRPNIVLNPTFTICKGDSVNLNASASPSGGTYNFNWLYHSSLSSVSISNPFAKPSTTQTYKLYVSTTAGCKDSLTTTVNVSTIRNEIDSMRTTNTTCGSSNGSISLYSRTSAPFNPPYQFSINGGASFTSANIFNGLSAGSYNVAIKNATGCRFDTVLTITLGAGAPTATYVKTNTSCGLNNGSATVTSKSGKAPLTLTWKLGATVLSNDTFLSNQPSGVYTLMVTDSIGCVTQYSVNILSSSALNITATKTDQTCGFANGSIIVSPTTGVSPYTYSWNSGETTNSISGKVAGTYKVTATDGNGCTKVDSFTLVSFPAISTSKNSTNVTCGLANGSAQAIISSGGTAPFVYSWSNGVISPSTSVTTYTVNGLSAGKYFFTVSDSKGCIKIDSLTISSTPGVSISLAKTNAVCGNLNGTITTNILTGSPGYTYSWNDGSVLKNRMGLGVGTYIVTVTDTNGCTVTQSTTISTNANPVLTTTKINASCGLKNGRIFSNLTGAIPPITYLWSNGKTTSFIDTLLPGIYSVTMTDSIGCQKTATDTIIQPPYANFKDTIIQPTCGLSNGSITLSSITGKSPITILWNNGSSSLSRTGLSAGTYNVIVQDSNGCSKSKSFTINSSSSPAISDSIIQAYCNKTVGSIYSKISGGIGPYRYAWSSGDTVANILNKTPGSYTVTVTDQIGCTAVYSDSILRRPSPTYQDTLYKARCGLNNGWISVYNVVGSGPMTYTWFHDGTINSGFVSGLQSTMHYLTITDVNGCQLNDSFDVSSNGPITLTYTVQKPKCMDSNGKIILNLIGGNPPYNIQWSNGDTGIIADTLKHAKYGLFIVDKLGCIYRDTIKVKDSTLIQDSFQIIHTRCDTPTGRVISFPYGGTAPYKFKWSRAVKDTFATIDSLKIGLYDLRITDSNGCKYDTFVNIRYDHYPIINYTVQSERCDSANAVVQITVDSVISPIKIYWNNVLDSTYKKSTLTGPQFLPIHVIDSQKCRVDVSVEVTEIAVSYPSLSIVQPPCGNNTGSIYVNIAIGKKYVWNTGDTTQFISPLGPGFYSVTITDTTGCRFVRSDTLKYTIPPIRNHTIKRSNCGLNDGFVKSVITTPYHPVQFYWYKLPGTPGSIQMANSDTILNVGLDSGRYVLSIVDGAGCPRSDTFYVKDSAAHTINFAITNSNCFNGLGKIKANPIGGSPPFSYLWYNFTTKDSLVNLNAGTYRLSLTDGRSCVAVDSANVTFSSKPELNLLGLPAKCGLNNGQIITTVNFGKPPYTYSWSNSATTKNLSGLGAGTYRLTITDSIGCTDVDSVMITAQPPLQISLSKTVAFCDLNNGSATAVITSGVPPYIYNWNGSTNALTISGLDSGKHVFQITDSNSCVIRDSVYIPRVSKPSVTHSVVHDNCTYLIGQITTTVVGGKAPLSYLWSNSLGTNPSVTNLGAGTYTLSVTDSLGCQVVKTSIVNDTAGPVVSLVVTDATCGLSNGAINANVTSTKTPLSYFWNNVSGTTSITGINGGKFVFKVIDNRGCIKRDSVIIDTIKVLVATKNFKQGSCNLNNGFIKVNPSGGIPPYSYTWGHTGANLDSVYGLSSGTYKITVNDSKGCLWIDSVVITQMGMPNIAFNKIPATCRQSNGSVTAVLTNISGTYTYLWNTGDTTAGLTNKSAGNFSLTISDGTGCTASSMTSLTTIGVDSIDLQVTQPKCDVNNGKIKAILYNSVGNKVYTWNVAGTKDSLVNLWDGNYALTVTDSFCTYNLSTTLTMAKSPQLTITKVNASCGINNGSVTTSVIYGAPPLTYIWNSGQTSASIYSQDSGLYTVMVSDTNGCKDTATISVSRIPKLSASFVTIKSTCGNPNGAIQTTVSGGVLGYTYNWSNGSNLANQNNILAGTYTLTLNDNGNCTITENVTVDDRKKPKITVIINRPVCAKNNGGLDVTIVDGNPPFTYLWNTGQTSQDLSNLSPGIYKLTVLDNIGCTDSATFVVDPGTTPMYDVDSTYVVNSTCGLANGRIQVSMGRAVDPIFTWSNGYVGPKNNNLAVGKYVVTMTDSRGCILSDSFIVKTTTLPKIDLQSINSYCGRPTGSVSSSVSFGTAPYRYTWSNGDTTKNITNVMKGVYTVTVFDTFNCRDTETITVLEDKNNVFASVQRIHLKCFNDRSGSVIFTPSGGEYPYTYNVNSPAPDSIIYFLSSGLYSFTVTDNKGCEYKDTFTLTQPNPLSTVVTRKQNLLCYGEPSGEIDVKSSGGTYPYSYSWLPSRQLGDNVTGLSAGIHTAIVTDLNGCIDTVRATLTQPNDLRVFPSITNNPCNGQSKGAISLVVSQGTPPYVYKWSNGQTTKDVSGLYEGSYPLTIMDVNGCIDTFKYTLVDPPKLATGQATAIGLKCKGVIDGEVFVLGTGGQSPYKYSIDKGKTYTFNNRFLNLDMGTYIVYIQDANLCTTTATAVVDNYPEFKIEAYPHNATIELDQTLQLGYQVSVGNVNFVNSTLWKEGDGLSCVDCIQPTFHGYTDRSYVVEVKYLDKCYAYDTVRIKVQDKSELYVPNSFAPLSNTSAENKVLKVYANHLISAHLTIYNRWGQKMFESTEAHVKGWDGYYNGELAQSGVYTFKLTATFLNQRIIEQKGSVTLIR